MRTKRLDLTVTAIRDTPRAGTRGGAANTCPPVTHRPAREPMGNTMLRQYKNQNSSAHAGNSKQPVRWTMVLSALLLAGSAAAQSSSATVSQPVLGLVYDAAAQTLHTLTGIPAASQLGGSLGGTPLAAVAISSQQPYALALEQGTGAALLVSLSGRQPLTGVRAGAQLAAVSPRGTAAAVYFNDTGKASILTGLPDAPQALRDVTLDGSPSVLAVSDDGSSLAAVISLATNQATVFFYSAAGAGQALLSDRQFSSLDFVPGGTTPACHGYSKRGVSVSGPPGTSVAHRCPRRFGKRGGGRGFGRWDARLHWHAIGPGGDSRSGGGYPDAALLFLPAGGNLEAAGEGRLSPERNGRRVALGIGW